MKGHQDDSTPRHLLSLPSQLNVLMDNIAKDMLTDHMVEEAITLHPHPLTLPLAQHKQQYIHQDFKRSLYNAIMETKAHKYWTDEKHRYLPQDINKIDWQSQSKALKTMRTTKQRSLSKWFSGWMGSGKNMERWNLRYKGACPFCSHPRENTTHILKCQHDNPTEEWKNQIKVFDQKLIKLNTNYYLRKAIIYELIAWRKNSLQQLPTLLYADDELKQAILEQRSLGWTVFLEGLISTKIIAYQREFHLRTNEKQHGFNWPKKVIKAGWNIITSMWDNRNKALHVPNTLEEMQGIQVLNRVIKTEWELGLHNLPMLEFSHLFRGTIDELMNKSTDGKKDWLATVKLARNLHNDTTYNEDEFETNQALRDWIGLPKI